MAQKTIPQLQEATDFDESVLIPIDTGIQTFKITGENFIKSMVSILAQTAVKSVSDDYNVDPADRIILATGTKTITLPAAADVEGFDFTIKNVGTGVITVALQGIDTADGIGTSLSLAEKFQFMKFVSDGTNYNIVSW